VNNGLFETRAAKAKWKKLALWRVLIRYLARESDKKKKNPNTLTVLKHDYEKRISCLKDDDKPPGLNGEVKKPWGRFLGHR